MDGESVSKQARIEYIDLFRAFGIFVMIMGHVAFGGIFDKWIHIFHMPMFFIISGYFYRDQTFRSLLKRKVKTLLVPYFVFGLTHLVIYFLRIGSIDGHSFYLFFWENTAESGIPIAGALWFLTAIFFSEILLWCVQHLRLGIAWKNVIAATLAISGMACATYLPFRLPFALDVSMVGVGLYQIGKVIRDRCSKVLELNLVVSIIGIIVFSVLGMLNGYVNLRTGNYGIWPLFWVVAVGMTITLWNFFRCLYERVEGEGRRVFKRIESWVMIMGRDSIVFLCLNQLAILFVTDLISVLIPSSNTLYLLISQLIVLALAVLALYLARWVIMNTKLKVSVGKW